MHWLSLFCGGPLLMYIPYFTMHFRESSFALFYSQHTIVGREQCHMLWIVTILK